MRLFRFLSDVKLNGVHLLFISTGLELWRMTKIKHTETGGRPPSPVKKSNRLRVATQIISVVSDIVLRVVMGIAEEQRSVYCALPGSALLY